MKRPSFQFYPGDWLHDIGVRACSLAARGLWMDMLSFMHQANPYGHLLLPTVGEDGGKDGGKDILKAILPPILARMVGSTSEEVERLLAELEQAEVFSRTAEGVIFSRRMVQDEKAREARASGGVYSLKNPNVPRPKATQKDTLPGSLGISLGGSPSSSSSSSNLKPYPQTSFADDECEVSSTKNLKPTESQVEQVYSLYPRKRDKLDAKKAIRKAVAVVMAGDADHPAMSVADALDYVAQRATLYAQCVQGCDRDFIPYPASWFNAGSFWDDDRDWSKQQGKTNGNGVSPVIRVEGSALENEKKFGGSWGNDAMTATSIYDLDLGRELPASLDMERSILGAILLDGRAFNEAAERLAVGDFHLDSHRRIYRAMQRMTEAAHPVDIVTLTEELNRHRELEPIGDPGYIASLVEGLPERPSIRHYVEIVKEKARLRGLVSAAQVAIARALDSDTSTEIAGGLLETILNVEAQAKENHALTGRDFMPQVLQELEAQSQAGGLVGLPTGLDPLDALTGGLRKEELIVVGALPGAGKTALACQIIEANAEAGNGVGVFSIEMSRWDLGRRFLSAVTDVSAGKIRKPQYIGKTDWPALARGAAEVSEWPIWIDDSGAVSIAELLARARLFIHRMKAKLIIVDYLQLVRADARDVRERVSKVADALRQLAKAEQVPVVLLSQLRRPQNVNDPPTIVDLKESGDIEAHAHIVLLIHAPAAADGNSMGEDTIIVAKNRNGSRGPVAVRLNVHKLKFYSRTDARDSQTGMTKEAGDETL